MSFTSAGSTSISSASFFTSFIASSARFEVAVLRFYKDRRQRRRRNLGEAVALSLGMLVLLVAVQFLLVVEVGLAYVTCEAGRLWEGQRGREEATWMLERMLPQLALVLESIQTVPALVQIPFLRSLKGEGRGP